MKALVSTLLTLFLLGGCLLDDDDDLKGESPGSDWGGPRIGNQGDPAGTDPRPFTEEECMEFRKLNGIAPIGCDTRKG